MSLGDGSASSISSPGSASGARRFRLAIRLTARVRRSRMYAAVWHTERDMTHAQAIRTGVVRRISASVSNRRASYSRAPAYSCGLAYACLSARAMGQSAACAATPESTPSIVSAAAQSCLNLCHCIVLFARFVGGTESLLADLLSQPLTWVPWDHYSLGETPHPTRRAKVYPVRAFRNAIRSRFTVR